MQENVDPLEERDAMDSNRPESTMNHRLLNAHMILFLSAAMCLGGCGEAATPQGGTGGSGSRDCDLGSEGCACYADACLAGLRCLSNVCVDAGDDGGPTGDGGVRGTNNLAAADLEVMSQETRAGYPLDLKLSVTSDEPTENVGVSIYTIRKSDVEQDAENVRQLLVGTSTIAMVDPGTNDYQFEVDVPANIDGSEDYVLLAIVDEVNVVAETDEEDGFAATEMALEPIEFPRLPPAGEPVNVFIDEIFLDSRVFMAGGAPEVIDGVYTADATATLFLGAQGADQPIAVEAYATLRFTRSNVTPCQFRCAPETLEVPLYLWDSDAQRYLNAYGLTCPESGCYSWQLPDSDLVEWLPIDAIQPQLTLSDPELVSHEGLDRKSVHLDVYYPSSLMQNALEGIDNLYIPLGQPPPPNVPQYLQGDVRSFFGAVTWDNYDDVVSSCIEIKIRPADPNVIDRFVEDNIRCVPVDFVLPNSLSFRTPPPPPPPMFPSCDPQDYQCGYPALFAGDYHDTWDSEFFGSSVDFWAQATADERGLIAEGGGGVEVYALGQRTEFIGFDARAQVLPIYEGMPEDETPGFSLNLRFAGQTVYEVPLTPEIYSTPSLTFEVSKEFKGGEKKFQKFLYPVTVDGKLTGNIGVEYSAELAIDELVVACEPYINLEASVSVSVGIGIVSVGAEGALTIVEERFRIEEGATLEVVSSGFGGELAQLTLQPHLRLENEITGANGSLSIFLEYTEPSTCDCYDVVFLGCVPIPCLKSVRLSEKIAKFELYKKTDLLLERSTIINVFSLGGKTRFYGESY